MYPSIEGSRVYGPRLVVAKCLLVVAVASVAACSSLRVIGGRDVSDDELPYVVRLEWRVEAASDDVIIIRYFHICTCSVLTPEWTLTARHCVEDIAQNSTLVRETKATKLKIVSSKDIIRYGPPSSIPLKARTSYVLNKEVPLPRYQDLTADDIALLKTEPIQISRYGKISGLHFDTLFYQEVTLVGYGLTNYTLTNYSTPILAPTLDLMRPLQLVKGMLVHCADYSFPYLCVNQACGRRAALCPGDSGGPVVHRSRIVAVNSLAPVVNNCQMILDVIRVPQIVVVNAVSPYVDWISNVINNKY